MVPGRAGRRAGQPRAGALPVPRGPGRRRLPPNNWESVFGGPGLDPGRRTASGTSTSSTPPSPTSTGATPRSATMFEDVLRFWLDRGVDGFRVDVAHGLFKEEALRDQVVEEGERAAPASRRRALDGRARAQATSRCGTSPRCTTSTARWRQILDEYDGDRMAVAEAWTQTPESMARVRPPRRAAPGLQLRLAARRLVGRGVRRGRHRHARRRRRRSAPRPPGCSATTTSSGT